MAFGSSKVKIKAAMFCGEETQMTKTMVNNLLHAPFCCHMLFAGTSSRCGIMDGPEIWQQANELAGASQYTINFYTRHHFY